MAEYLSGDTGRITWNDRATLIAAVLAFLAASASLGWTIIDAHRASKEKQLASLYQVDAIVRGAEGCCNSQTDPMVLQASLRPLSPETVGQLCASLEGLVGASPVSDMRNHLLDLCSVAWEDPGKRPPGRACAAVSAARIAVKAVVDALHEHGN